MAEDSTVKKTPKKMPKGGARGGTRFPRIALGAAADYAQKLVSKTHNGPQPSSIILPGVFGSITTAGKVKAAALIQYGLLVGSRTSYEATPLAKKIVAAPQNERSPLLTTAFANVKLFKQLYETFQNDSVSRAKIRQQALSMKVHLDSVDECIEIFVKSLIAASLGSESGDSVSIVGSQRLAREESVDESEVEDQEEDVEDSETDADISVDVPTEKDLTKLPSKSQTAAVTVNFAVDSSLDTDKLQKQLALLRKFGVI